MMSSDSMIPEIISTMSGLLVSNNYFPDTANRGRKLAKSFLDIGKADGITRIQGDDEVQSGVDFALMIGQTLSGTQLTPIPFAGLVLSSTISCSS